MHTNQLETFLWVAALKNFHAAAGRMNLTQPAISARIAALEAEIGSKLLNRNGTSVTLTREGQDVMRYAQEMLRLTKELRRRKPAPDSGQKTVKIGIVETLAYAWLSELVMRVKARYPGIDMEIVTDSAVNIQRLLARRDIDVGLVVGVVYEPNVRCVWLTQYDLEWLGNPEIRQGRPVMPLKEIARHTIVTYEEATHVNFEIRKLFKANRIVPVRMVGCTAVGIILDLVRKGVGIGVLPAATAIDSIQKNEIEIIRSKSRLPKFDVFACYPLDSPTTIGLSIADIAQHLCGDAVRRKRTARPSARFSAPRFSRRSSR